MNGILIVKNIQKSEIRESKKKHLQKKVSESNSVIGLNQNKLDMIIWTEKN